MSSWRDKILKEFTPKVSRLTLVADPDGLLLEEGILEGIRERGFELIPFEDHIAFRYAYESQFRSRWDRGEQTDLVVVLRTQTSDLGALPYDLLHAGRRLAFSLGEIFPNLSYPVVTALDRGDLDALYEAQKRHAPGQLGDNATKEFVLRHVFEIAPELIRQTKDLLHMLLRRHYRNQRIPKLLDERFIQLLRQNSLFNDWPIESLLADRESFFAFLQERWPVFLANETAKSSTGVHDNKDLYGVMSIKGPIDLPFDHDDIRVYIDNLFVEGFLHPVSHDSANALSKTWMSIGIQTAPAEDKSRRLVKLIASLKKSIPASDAKHTEWFQFARGWSEMLYLQNESSDAAAGDMHEYVQSLLSEVDAGFTTWLLKRYAGLVNLPPAPPVMLHHLPRFLVRQLDDDRKAKIALIVVDGLAMNQWLVVRSALSSSSLSLPGYHLLHPFRGKLPSPAGHPSFFRTAFRPQTKNLRSGRSFGWIRVLRRTRLSTSRGWVAAVWKPFPRQFLIKRCGLLAWLWIRLTRSCTEWSWVPPGCTIKWASGLNSRI
jgi:hypothetical protein